MSFVPAIRLHSVGVTATREGATEPQLASLHGWMKARPRLALHHGDCLGGDAQAHGVAKRLGWYTVAHPSDIPAMRAYCNDCDEIWPEKRPLVRNRDIVVQTDEMVAMPKGPEELRSGTWSTIRFARRIGRPVTIIWPDGTISPPAA